jgi:hypothetical protein
MSDLDQNESRQQTSNDASMKGQQSGAEAGADERAPEEGEQPRGAAKDGSTPSRPHGHTEDPDITL